jgi:hypothetical protein
MRLLSAAGRLLICEEIFYSQKYKLCVTMAAAQVVCVVVASAGGYIVYKALTSMFGRPEELPKPVGNHGSAFISRSEFMDRIDMHKATSTACEVDVIQRNSSVYEFRFGRDLCLGDVQLLDDLKSHAKLVSLKFVKA